MNTEYLGIIATFLLTLIIAIPLGKYLAKVFAGEKVWTDFLKPLESGIFKLSGINPKEQMDWKQNLKILLLLNTLGQSFTKPDYFWGRPSAVGYNAAGSAGSNKGPSNADYLKEVSNRLDTILKYDPTIKRGEIPADMVTASGSGLDPNISEQGALIQIKRIAAYRKIDENKIAELVVQHTNGPFLGLFGPSSVNVLNLNLALDDLGNRK